MRLKKIVVFVFSLILMCIIETGTARADDALPYTIKVNRAKNCITVYSKDEKGEYTIPYKAMVCSTGLNEGSTPVGAFVITDKYDWNKLVDGSYGQYCTRIVDSVMFHSVPYFAKAKNRLEFQEFNKLGEPASLGCVRLLVSDAKWIFDNCPAGTVVEIYDDQVSPGPLGKPVFKKVPEDHPYKDWDPSDDDVNNPWKTLSPVIEGVSDKEVMEDRSVDLLDTVTAKDIIGNDISALIKVEGDYNEKIPGVYDLKYTITDSFGYYAEAGFKLTIKQKEVTTTKKQAETTTTISENSDKKTDKNSVVTIGIIAFITLLASIIISLLMKNNY